MYILFILISVMLPEPAQHMHHIGGHLHILSPAHRLLLQLGQSNLLQALVANLKGQDQTMKVSLASSSCQRAIEQSAIVVRTAGIRNPARVEEETITAPEVRDPAAAATLPRPATLHPLRNGVTHLAAGRYLPHQVANPPGVAPSFISSAMCPDI